MTLVKAIVAAACAVAATGSLWAQTRIDLRTQASSVVDFGTATFTRPIRTGTALPAVCDTGELFFKSDAPAGANVYACVSRNLWAAPAAPATGALLPNLNGHAGKSLWTDGLTTVWKTVTTGGSGALELTQTGSEVSLDIVSAVVPQKSAANLFSGLNTFGLGIQLSPQPAPATPENGRIWYDSALQKFRCRQNGVTFDCISAATTRTIAAGSGISVANGDGANGDPTISVAADLLNVTAPQTAATALMGPLAGGPATPSFRALIETDLPSSIARKPAANTFTSLNSFGAGIQLLPQGTPALPENGQVWYDANVHKFRCHQNGLTSDCIGGGSTHTITAGSGISVANGDGVNGDPTISVTADLLNVTAPQIPATALMGPVSGSPAAPSFRALTDTDLPPGVALKPATNTFTGLNIFDIGIQLSAQAAPQTPQNGQIWYDANVHKFRCRQNGLTSDCIGGGSTHTITAGSGINVANGDGVNGDPTISVTADLLNVTAPQTVATALMGPASGGPATPEFRALTETDLPNGVALKTAANSFTGVNTFSAGIQLSSQTPPANPQNGHIWYDSATGRFRARENGQTVDVRGGSGGLGDPGQNGLIVRTAPNTTTVATPGVHYVPATTGTAVQKANGSGGLTAATAGVDFAAAQHTHVYPIYGTGNTAISAGSTQFANLVGGAIVTSTNTKRTIMSHGPGTLTNFWLVTGNNAGSGTLTCTVQKFVSGSWADTSLTVSVSTSTIGNVGQSTGSATYVAGDQFIVACSNTASASSTIGAWSMQDIH